MAAQSGLEIFRVMTERNNKYTLSSRMWLSVKRQSTTTRYNVVFGEHPHLRQEVTEIVPDQVTATTNNISSNHRAEVNLKSCSFITSRPKPHSEPFIAKH